MTDRLLLRLCRVYPVILEVLTNFLLHMSWSEPPLCPDRF